MGRAAARRRPVRTIQRPQPCGRNIDQKPRPRFASIRTSRRPPARRPAPPSREPSRRCRPAASSIVLSCPLSSSRPAGEPERELEKQARAQEMAGDDALTGGATAEEEPHVERLPADILAQVLSLLPSFHDLSMAGGVSRRWRRAVGRSLATRRRLSFAGQRTGDESTARLVRAAVNLRDLDICWGCQITDQGLLDISTAACVGNLTSVSLWGLAGITDKGVVHLVSRAHSLQHLNIGGTFITDESLYAVADSCSNLKSIILWSCRHVTEAGLVALVHKCPELECINVGGMRVSPESFAGLKSISPALRIRSIPQILNADVQVA
ncbi:F-box protein At5g67140-like isoform X2 [Hordeum vulgare subsp. vulgare]|uniref:F-box domain-containing protein n=1 Tax=Hordeum vulgare subsp. vulgare TaxID=112509 RepID=A0A8I6Z1R2_HORVV|nr:F-box protein At5g67140-like isoform X2 [Hordeum vulgare subsp. vulgare]